MTEATLSQRQRKIIIAAAGKLVSSSTPGEREVMFQRIDEELKRIGMRWDEIFARGLPEAQLETPDRSPAKPNNVRARSSMMNGFSDMMGKNRPPIKPRARYLVGDEIPRMVIGRLSIREEREWQGRVMMIVDVRNDEFIYTSLVIFEERDQQFARQAEANKKAVSGMVKQPTNPAHSPVLYNLGN